MFNIGRYLEAYTNSGQKGDVELANLLSKPVSEETFAKILAVYGCCHWELAETRVVHNARAQLGEIESQHHFLENELKRIQKKSIEEKDRGLTSYASSLLCYAAMFDFPGDRTAYCRFYDYPKV